MTWWIVHALPLFQMVLCFGAAVVYLLAHDYRRAIYWAAAGTITATITF